MYQYTPGGTAPCNVQNPTSGCCGNGKAWIWHPAFRNWVCVDHPNCS